MTGSFSLTDPRLTIERFWADESGASLVEFALVITLFLFLLLAIIDFGRIGHAWVSANKATQLAARLAAVRPPVCTGVPATNDRGSDRSPKFGALCRAGANVCANPGIISCVGRVNPDPRNLDGNTAQEIFDAIRPLIPAGTTINQMRYTYAFNPDPESVRGTYVPLGFLGGPFVPMVTVELGDPPLRPDDPTVPLTFPFISPLWPFVTALTGQSSDLGRVGLQLPVMSVSLPGEDLNLGTGG